MNQMCPCLPSASNLVEKKSHEKKSTRVNLSFTDFQFHLSVSIEKGPFPGTSMERERRSYQFWCRGMVRVTSSLSSSSSWSLAENCNPCTKVEVWPTWMGPFKRNLSSKLANTCKSVISFDNSQALREARSHFIYFKMRD